MRILRIPIAPPIPTATAEIIDLNSPNPAWIYTGSMVTGGRKLHNATLLADGKVLVTGGSRGTEDPNTQPSNPAYACELWDPATGTWTTMASLTKIRAYHSIALLLPDGRVLSAGGELRGSLSRNIFASLSVPRLPSNYQISSAWPASAGTRSRISSVLRGHVVRRDHAAEALEPERAHLGEHRALPRDRLAHDDVERAHPVAGDEQQVVGVDLVDLAHLAAAQQRQRQPALGQRSRRASYPHLRAAGLRRERPARARAAAGGTRSRNSPTCCAARPV